MGNTGDKSIGYQKELLRLCETDPDIIVMTAENLAVIRNLPQVLGDRFIDVGIAEQTLVGMATGLSLNGSKVVLHALAPFLTMRAFEFVRTDLGLHDCNVTMVGFIPGFLSDANGPTHQAVEDIALMRCIPGIKIFTPSCEEESAIILAENINTNSIKYIRLNHIPCSADNIVATAEDVRQGFQLIKAEVTASTAIVSHGALIDQVYPILRDIQNLDLVKVIDASTENMAILNSTLSNYRKIICIEDHLDFGSVGHLMKTMSDSSYEIFNINFGNNYFTPASSRKVFHLNGYSTELLKAKVLEITSLHANL